MLKFGRLLQICRQIIIFALLLTGSGLRRGATRERSEADVTAGIFSIKPRVGRWFRDIGNYLPFI